MTKTDIIKQLFAAYAKGDVPSILAAMDDAVVWIEPGDTSKIPFSGVFKGKSEILRMFGIEHQLLQVTAFAPECFLENENTVVVLGSDSATVLTTKKSYTTQWTMAFTFSGNLISQVQVYMDTLAVASAFVPDSQPAQ
jgi:ketosteroid isomerase-like protein